MRWTEVTGRFAIVDQMLILYRRIFRIAKTGDVPMLIRLLLLFAVAAAHPAGTQQGNSAPASPVPPARVYIYQLKIRGARANPIWCDELQVARLRQRWSYFVIQIRPGEHSFRGR